MKKTILILFMIFVSFNIVVAAQEKVMSLTLQYDNGTVTKEGLVIGDGFFFDSVDQPTDGYRVELLSSDGKVLYTQYFDFSLGVFGSPPDPDWFDDAGNQIYIPPKDEVTVTRKESRVELILPVYEEARFITIYDPDNQIIDSIDLKPGKPKAETALIGEQEIIQDQQDVLSEDGGLSDRFYLMIAGSILLILLLAGIILFIKLTKFGKKKDKPNTQNLDQKVITYLNKGYPKTKVRDGLKKRGYSDKEITAILNRVSSKVKNSSKPKKYYSSKV